MNKYMKRGVFLSVLFALVLTGLYAQDEWQWDADRADEYFRSGDSEAAWLFYERSLIRGCDDGLVVFRAAESFRQQEMIDNPEFGTALYAVAAHFLQGQYPDNPALKEAESFFDEGTIVNRRYLRQTYAAIGAKAPRARRPVTEGFDSVTGFFASRLEELGQFFLIMRSDGVRVALSWAGERPWSLLLSLLIVNSLTGIILPVVMAITVAREGRKSYVTAYAFLLHWGPLGIHRFYLGRYASGIIWLLTGGLLGIGVFFDLFLTGAYIRFWNEDNRGDRPVQRSRSTERIKPKKIKKQKVKKTRPPKAVKQPRTAKPPKEPKKPGTPKKQKPEKAESAFDSTPELDDNEGFSFGTASAAAATSEIVSDDDFGDLPDLSFDDGDGDDSGLEDFAISSESSNDDFSAELPEELNDEDFDIKSFD